MIYKKIQPSEKLASFVKCYYYWEHVLHDQSPLVIQSPPVGYEAIVFNYGDPYKFIRKLEETIEVPKASYSGQNTANFQLHLQGTIGMFGVVFQPAAFSTLFRISVKDTADQRIALDDILGCEGKHLAIKMLDASSTSERIQLMERFLLQKLWLSKLHITAADKAAHLIDRRNGIVNVQDLTAEIGSSSRSLQRQFIEKVGISPKFYARIRRFSYISYRLIYRKDNWKDLAYDAGYYDHSHFIKDFQFFNRQNPSAYLQQHQELIKYVEQ